jgi:hypothetical protein
VDPRPEPAPAAILEPRQRWRLTLARGQDAPRLAGRELNEAWEAALETAGLPLARGGGGSKPKSPVAFAAPLPVGMAAEAELMDVTLCDRWPAWRAREALIGSMLPGWTLMDVEDVWLGAPALAAAVCAADYRIARGDVIPRRGGRRTGAARAKRLRGEKGGSSVRYDLRRLESIEVVAGSPVVPVRTRPIPSSATVDQRRSRRRSPTSSGATCH